MDTFKSISWNVPVELEIDFASAEEFKSTSVAYKILHGSFKTDLSSDSSDEHLEFDKKIPGKKTSKKKKAKKSKRDSSKNDLKETTSIIASKNERSEDGVRYSSFTAAQHSSYLEMLCVVQNQRTSIPPEWREMKEAVEKEQTEFLKHIREIWKTSFQKHLVLSDGARKFTEDMWKSQLRRVKSYPRLYVSLRKIPLVYPDDKSEVQMVPVRVLLEMGVVPKFYPPNSAISSKICTDYSTMLLLNAPSSDDADSLLHIPVSWDKNAEVLAVNERADVVISSSSLNCIADNIAKFDKEWNIPFVVKQYSIKGDSSSESHKVVYIDKRLPAKAMNSSEGNAWFHKQAIKCLMCHHRDPTAFRYPENQSERLDFKFRNFKLINSHEKCQDMESDSFCKVCKLPKQLLKEKRTDQDSSMSEDDSSESGELVIDMNDADTKCEKICSCETTTDKDERDFQNDFQHQTGYSFIPPSSKTNVTYRLWKLNCEERCKEDLNKDFLKGRWPHKDIKVLVRCKIDACEHDNNQVLPLCISCKLEHQAEYGAEKMNVSEILREWTRLFFRPEAILKRIRINVMTEEVILTEKVTLREIANTASHLYELRIRRTVLGSLYQVLSDLVSLRPGYYLLSHDLRKGPFVCVLQQTNNRDFDYDLHADYEVVNPAVVTRDVLQWTPIDPNIITAKHITTKQIPGTFQPAT